MPAAATTAWPLTNIADVQRMRGELDAARNLRTRSEAAQLTDPQFVVFAGFTCALIEYDRGNTGRGAGSKRSSAASAMGAGTPAIATTRS